MKTINVSAAIIVSENRIFVTQRGYGEFKDMWEFPGGKIENNESPEAALIREIKEELDADIEIISYLNKIEYTYPSFHLVMHNFICKLKENHLSLLEHEAAKYISIDELDSVDFLPADLLILPDLKKYFGN
ncbi:MAG: (deoxy)nucleoside triphosphate pyrophosphohydrolase [Bacilli bacterium]|nr:(deoxy)nucleoside triphosphate pyrophosphohydrolase [Bacilli bacterium]